MFVQAFEANYACFGKAPEACNAGDIWPFADKLTAAVLHAKVFLIAHTYKTAISAPIVRVDNAFKPGSATDYPL